MFTSMEEKISKTSFCEMWSSLSDKDNIRHVQAKNGTKIYYDAYKTEVGNLDLSEKDHLLTERVAEKLENYINNNPFSGFRIKKAFAWARKIAIATTVAAAGCALLAVTSPYIYIAAAVSIIAACLLYAYDYSLKTKRNDYINIFLNQLNEEMKSGGEVYEKSRWTVRSCINWCRGGHFALACPDLGFYSLNWTTVGTSENEEENRRQKENYENIVFKKF